MLEKYNQGTCTPEETAIVEHWFDSIQQDQTTSMDDGELDFQLSDIKSRIDQQIALPKPIRRIRSWYIAAAAAALLIIAGLFWFNQRTPVNDTADKVTLAPAPALAIRTIKNGFVEHSTPRMVKDTISLPDGSTILLNAGSRLRYPEKFSNTERSIWLEEGEAYFDAAQDPARSFVVHTGALTTTALGTTFNIRTYATENKVTVALFTGKVKIDHINKAGSTASSLVLMPNEQVSFDPRQLSLNKTSLKKNNEVSDWKKGYLVFSDASYNELVNGLENHFGVTVMNQSSKTEWNYTGTFHNESLEEVMKTICIATSISYAIKNDTVILVNQH